MNSLQTIFPDEVCQARLAQIRALLAGPGPLYDFGLPGDSPVPPGIRPGFHVCRGARPPGCSGGPIRKRSARAVGRLGHDQHPQILGWAGPAGQNWRFSHNLLQGNSYIDDYREYDTSYFADPFDSQDASQWTFSTHTSVSGGMVQNTGTGSDYLAALNRTSFGVQSGMGVVVRFKVDNANSDSHLQVGSASGNNLVEVVLNSSKATVTGMNNGVSIPPLDLVTNLQTGKWYLLRITLEDNKDSNNTPVTNVTVSVNLENDPTTGGHDMIQGMPAGIAYEFKAQTKYGVLNLDDYQEYHTHVHAITTANGVQKYWYDSNGNQVRREVNGQTFILAYDAENRLVGVSGAATATFGYRCNGKSRGNGRGK